MKFGILIGLFSVFLMVSSANGACLELGEINIINSMESQLNISNNSLMNLMESMCIRVTDAKINITASLDDYTNTSNMLIELNDLEYQVESNYTQRMDNYTEWFNEQLETSSILAEMLKILNASKNIENIDKRIEDKTNELINQVDDRFEAYLTIEHFDRRFSNMTAYFGSSNVPPSGGFFGFNEVIIFWIVAILVAGYLISKQMNKKEFPKGLIKRLPFRRTGKKSINLLNTDSPERRDIEEKLNKQLEMGVDNIQKNIPEKSEKEVPKDGKKTVHDTAKRGRKEDH